MYKKKVCVLKEWVKMEIYGTIQLSSTLSTTQSLLTRYYLFLLNQIPFQFNLISPPFLIQQKMHNTAKNKPESEPIIEENVEISTTSRYNPI